MGTVSLIQWWQLMLLEMLCTNLQKVWQYLDSEITKWTAVIYLVACCVLHVLCWLDNTLHWSYGLWAFDRINLRTLDYSCSGACLATRGQKDYSTGYQANDFNIYLVVDFSKHFISMNIMLKITGLYINGINIIQTNSPKDITPTAWIAFHFANAHELSVGILESDIYI